MTGASQGSSTTLNRGYMSNSFTANENMNITSRLRGRELNNHCGGARFVSRNYINKSMLQQLRFEKELKGHSGCVNCLDWSEEGSLLLSGSDDTHAIVWDPFTYEQKETIHTAHTDNIFAVKFFPKTNNGIVATGAGDSNVYVHDLSHNVKVHGYSCSGRVKKIVATPIMPHNIWSASEDGIVREFDIRESPKSCTKNLIDLTPLCTPQISCKTLAINPVQPHLLAIGASDPFVRIYDRRMIISQNTSKLVNGGKRAFDPQTSESCVSYFAPGHLYIKHKEDQQRMRFLSATHVAFSPDGNELLVNIGAEQVYLFDLNSKKHTIFQSFPDNLSSASSSKSIPIPGQNKCPTPQVDDMELGSYLASIGKCPLPYSVTSYKGNRTLSPQAEELKEQANKLFGEKKFIQSISAYNAAIDIAPYSSVLYGNRAAAYLKRGWDGDVYAALRDCHMALSLNPSHAKAHFRMAKCLQELGQSMEAQACLADFKNCHSNYNNTTSCNMLDRAIKSCLKNARKQSTPAQQSTNDTNHNQVSEIEAHLQGRSYDYKQRYCGHCNTLTDIKEANFFGPNGQYIVAGSDDSSFFIWERKTSNLVRVMHADSSIVNCLQPHPYICLLASSGIDADVKLWSPQPSKDENDNRVVKDSETYTMAMANQVRMNRDPFETLLYSVGVSVSDNPSGESAVPCTTS